MNLGGQLKGGVWGAEPPQEKIVIFCYPPPLVPSEGADSFCCCVLEKCLVYHPGHHPINHPSVILACAPGAEIGMIFRLRLYSI